MMTKKNKRYLGIVTAIVLAITIAVVACLPLDSELPVSIPTITPEKDQETFIRQFQLGWRYEDSRDWANAQAAYAEAALAGQEEIAVQARNGLHRILKHQQSFGYQFQQTVRNLFSLWLTLFIILGIWFFFTQPIDKPGYLLLPFEDYTENKIGAGLHALILYYIQEAHHIHDQGRTQLLGFATSEFPLFAALTDADDNLSEVLSSLDVLNVGGVNVPFGRLMATVRKWYNQRKYTVTGNLQKHGDRIYLETQIRETDSRVFVAGWELSARVSQEKNSIDSLVEELAYRLLFHIGTVSQNAFEASSWRSLMLFTQGLRLFQTDTQIDIQEQLAQAENLFDEVITIDPGFLTGRYALGITQTRMGNYGKARGQFDEITEVGGNLALEATYNLGITYYHEFRPWGYDKAISYYQTVVNKLTEVETDHSDQKLLQALALTGIANTTAQMIGEESILEVMSPQSLIEQVEDSCRAASTLIQNGNDEYHARFVKALIHNARGIAAYYAEHHKDAKNELKNALRFQPDNLVAYGYLALISLKEYEEEQALEWFDRTLEWNPNPIYIEYFYYKFGRYFHDKNDWSRAKDYYSQAPNHPYAQNYLGEVYAQTGDFMQAITMFRLAIKLNRKIQNFWLNLAYYITKIEDDTLLPEAVEAANRAISIQDDWHSRDILGWVLIKQNNLTDAERQLHLSVKHNNQLVQNYYHLAYVNWQSGNCKKALEYIDIAFATPDKNGKWRKRAAKLREMIGEQIRNEDPPCSSPSS